MAGMLPGVEAARRRRFHQNSDFGRRSSLCLYASSHLRSSNSFTQQRNALCDESGLGVEAREAKKRLNERLQWRSQTPRSEAAGGLQVKKRLGWLKMRWKSSEQEECAVCLEQLKAPPPLKLMQLPCGHRFHTNCLLPWLEANAHCPCCRMQIPSSIF
ncbi:hypothetical protein ACS0TY_024218 [Phlomoides rotata]